MAKSELPIQPTINLGLVGHVDHGKTSITKLLSGKWTDTHSEEKKRGITIKLGYTNFTIYSDEKEENFSIKKDKEKTKEIKKVSIVDAPGHESFMATMISGAAVMDYALLLVAANEMCPQPQTIEHIKTLEIAGIKNIIVIQNKIDLVEKERALENYKQIKEFLSTTIYKDSKIIPMSAQYGANLNELLREISQFVEPDKKLDNKPLLNVIRSFDINKPGESYEKLQGGILGGSVASGSFKLGDEIEIKPGLTEVKNGKIISTPIYAKIEGLMSDRDKLEKATSGGSIAIKTSLDPTITKTDSLVGQIAGLKGELPEPMSQIKFVNNLFDKVITTSEEYAVKPFAQNEPLMLIVNSLTTVGVVQKTNPKETSVTLKKPVMAFNGDRVVIFRRFEGNKWRIIGHGIIKE